jgi:alpha 1,3-glucosidase
MVKHGDFKRCEQSGFCKRNRDLADAMYSKGSPASSPYRLDPKSMKLRNGQLEAMVLKSVSEKEIVRLPLTISFLESGVARVILDEEKRQKGQIELRHDSKARKERYNEAAAWALTGAGLQLNRGANLVQEESGYTKILYGPENKYEAVIRHTPFGVEFRKDGEKHIGLNGLGFMNFEHWRPKVEKPRKGRQ